MMKSFRILILMGFCATRLMAQNPIIPMTAITGDPDRSEVTALLCSYKEVGIDQFLIYPRSGLEIEYMSDRWMGFCRDCIEVADSLDMKVWLYDEYNWPSGNCRGAVTADGHEYLYPHLLMFDSDGHGNYSTRIAINAIGSDLLNPETTERFIALTHERYFEEFGEYFGRVIPAIFTDEPSFSYSVNSPSGMLEANFTRFDKDHFPLTWYEGLEEDYRAASGRDLHEDVVSYLKGGESSVLWTTYYTLVGERMRTAYISGLSKWCRAHGIELTGHLMYEKLYKSVRCNGNALKMLSEFGIPGFDEANSDIDINAREMEISGLSLVQYAGQGKKGEMCEMYSVGPADNSVSLMSQLMWMCSSFGVDSYVSAVSAFDARGNVEKGDWYFPSGPTQPWFSYYSELGREARRAAAFARKEYRPEVRVRVPSGYFMSLDKTPAFERQGVRYLRFLEGLLKWQLQYLLLDEDEDAGGLPVLCFGPDGFFVEGESDRFDKVDEFFGHVTSEVVKRAIVVTDESGSEVRDVLARLWADGSFTVTDITDNDVSDRILNVRTPRGEAQVRLLGHGTFAGTLKDARRAMRRDRRRAETIDMSGAAMIPDSTNMVRCTFMRDDPHFRFTVEGQAVMIRLHARTGTKPLKVLMDGEEIKVQEASSRLPYGFCSLYKASGWIVAEPGEHVLAAVADGEAVDYRYLPGIFMEGDFSYSRERHCFSPAGAMQHLSTAGAMPDYAGTYEIVKEGVQLPAKVVLNTNLACTELIVDGRSLGRKAWGPYEWNIPRRYRKGGHQVRVRISTSIMPMFGDVTLLDSDQPYVGWLRIKPGMHGDKTTTGLF